LSTAEFVWYVLRFKSCRTSTKPGSMYCCDVVLLARDATVARLAAPAVGEA
jgi:hypothetical protein